MDPQALNDDAEKYRRDLEPWALDTLRVRGEDYFIDEKGDRMYAKEKIDPYVKPLLTSMGLDVGTPYHNSIFQDSSYLVRAGATRCGDSQPIYLSNQHWKSSYTPFLSPKYQETRR